MDLQTIMLSEISQMDKDKIPHDFTYKQALKIKTKLTGNGEQSTGCWRRKGFGGDTEWMKGIKMSKLPVAK